MEIMPHDRNDCAVAILAWVKTLDVAWEGRLQALMDERRYTALQTLGACLGYVLDNALHMGITPHPAFEPGYRAQVNQPCPVCGTVFLPAYPGQPTCSNPCGTTYWQEWTEEHRQLDLDTRPEVVVGPGGASAGSA